MVRRLKRGRGEKNEEIEEEEEEEDDDDNDNDEEDDEDDDEEISISLPSSLTGCSLLTPPPSSSFSGRGAFHSACSSE